MKNKYILRNVLLASVALLIITIESCKKDSATKMVTPVTATPTQVGLYEADSAEFKELDVAISQVGNQSIDYGLVFDTGSGGMVLDADGIVPASMISSSGFTFAGDSIVVNGITITSQTSTLQYGADDSTLTTVYGNLAYAPVTIGDQTTGKVTIKRLPFCLYYKATDQDGNKLGSHYFDTFGVNSEYIYFSGNSFITSPFSYFDPGTGLTKGFKMAQLNLANFSYEGTYVANAVTLGLTASDVSSTSGFTQHTVNFFQGDGYVPLFPTTITYGSKKVSTNALFDSGTSGYSYIEDNTVTDTISLLPQNTNVSLTTNAGFTYSFITGVNTNLTFIENPTITGAEFSIISIDFFFNNEYMLNFSNQKLGLKNN